MNKLGISINQTNVEMIPAYAAAGFEVMEISLPNKPHEEIVALGERALELAKECGMELWSVHIPFGRSLEISSVEEAKRLNVLSMLMPSPRNGARRFWSFMPAPSPMNPLPVRRAFSPAPKA